jgi:predicted enzyme related to lactoylglutathione lyase
MIKIGLAACGGRTLAQKEPARMRVPDMCNWNLLSRVAGLLLLAPVLALASQAVAVAPVDTLPRNAAPHFNFLTLVVADFDRAFAFYTAVLGMKERGRAQPNAQYYEVVMGFDQQPLSTGISLSWRNGPPAVRGNGASSINLVVQDLAGILTRVTRFGGRVVTPLTRADGPRVTYSLARIEDPDGNALELVEYHRIAQQ